MWADDAQEELSSLKGCSTTRSVLPCAYAGKSGKFPVFLLTSPSPPALQQIAVERTDLDFAVPVADNHPIIAAITSVDENLDSDGEDEMNFPTPALVNALHLSISAESSLATAPATLRIAEENEATPRTTHLDAALAAARLELQRLQQRMVVFARAHLRLCAPYARVSGVQLPPPLGGEDSAARHSAAPLMPFTLGGAAATTGAAHLQFSPSLMVYSPGRLLLSPAGKAFTATTTGDAAMRHYSLGLLACSPSSVLYLQPHSPGKACASYRSGAHQPAAMPQPALHRGMCHTERFGETPRDLSAAFQSVATPSEGGAAMQQYSPSLMAYSPGMLLHSVHLAAHQPAALPQPAVDRGMCRAKRMGVTPRDLSAAFQSVATPSAPFAATPSKGGAAMQQYSPGLMVYSPGMLLHSVHLAAHQPAAMPQPAVNHGMCRAERMGVTPRDLSAAFQTVATPSAPLAATPFEGGAAMQQYSPGLMVYSPGMLLHSFHL